MRRQVGCLLRRELGLRALSTILLFPHSLPSLAMDALGVVHDCTSRFITLNTVIDFPVRLREYARFSRAVSSIVCARDRWRSEPSTQADSFGFFLSHRALAAFRAMSRLCSEVSFFLRAFPPSCPKCTA